MDVGSTAGCCHVEKVGSYRSSTEARKGVVSYSRKLSRYLICVCKLMDQDRHFLELLVVSEIHCLSHPLSVYSNPTAEKVHRHASRVRRVACERIGTERLHAYCDRVKEAFEAYMQGGWGRGYVKTETEASEEDLEGENEGEADGDDLEEGERGRGMDREGNQLRRDGPPSPPKIKVDGIQIHEDGDESDVKMVVDLSPLESPSPSLSSTDSDSEAESDTSLETASTSTGFGFMDDGERELVKNDLEGVIEVEEEAECDLMYVFFFHSEGWQLTYQ
jgi:hypothetical protein